MCNITCCNICSNHIFSFVARSNVLHLLLVFVSIPHVCLGSSFLTTATSCCMLWKSHFSALWLQVYQKLQCWLQTQDPLYSNTAFQIGVIAHMTLQKPVQICLSSHSSHSFSLVLSQSRTISSGSCSDYWSLRSWNWVHFFLSEPLDRFWAVFYSLV